MERNQCCDETKKAAKQTYPAFTTKPSFLKQQQTFFSEKYKTKEQKIFES